ncbi:MAG: hypothetical protein VCA36_08645, partial [Opitutales bacterium]
MVRTNSAKEHSINNVAAALENQEASDSMKDALPAAANNEKPNLPDPVPVAHERAQATLLIKLPASKYPRSKSESFSLKESYLGLHKEFISCERFFEHMSVRIRNNFTLGTLLAGSFEDGLITHSEILRNRLFFRLETDGESKSGPVLVLDAMGETSEAAMQLVELAQREYLRFVEMEEAASNHPRLVRQAAKLEVLREESRSLENDLAAYRQLNKKPARISQEADRKSTR